MPSEEDPLASSIELLELAGYSFDVEAVNQVWVNRDLRLSNIEWVGFDMDYTLALYEQEALDALSVQCTIDVLIEQHGYPESIRSIQPDCDFAIRGLVVDRQLGNILKMDSHNYVGKAFHGLNPTTTEVRRAYNELPLRKDDDRYRLLDTLFALPEVFLYAALIDHLEWHGVGNIPLDYQSLYDDVRAAIDLAHADGRIKQEILSNLPKYVVRDPDLAPTLHKFRSAGKRLFLLTNSELYYTNEVMSFLFDEVLSSYASWPQYFDVVVTSARKPSFFKGSSPFWRLDSEGEREEVETAHFERGRVYEGGNVTDFERLVSTHGPNILYVGDHIYGDIVRSKRDSAWRTAMIIQEMETELKKRGLMRDRLNQSANLDLRLASLNSELQTRKTLLEQLSEVYAPQAQNTDDELEGKVKRGIRGLRKSIDHLTKMRRETICEMIDLDEEISRNFNPYWGFLFKQGAEHSIFGGQVESYACLYTSKVSNFRRYSPMQYFRARRQVMPHEI